MRKYFIVKKINRKELVYYNNNYGYGCWTYKKRDIIFKTLTEIRKIGFKLALECHWYRIIPAKYLKGLKYDNLTDFIQKNKHR